MTTTEAPEPRDRTPGPDGSASRAPRAVDGAPALPDPQAATGRGGLRRRPRGDRAQRRHPPAGSRHRGRQLPRGGRDLPRGRRRRPGLARPLRARDVPLAGPGHGAQELHAARPQPRSQRRDRRPARGPRADLRLAVHPQPRRRPALRDDRGLPQLREAGLHEHDPPPRRRHPVRAHGPAGQQAPLRDGLQPHPLHGQGVHGLGHPSEPRPGLGRHGQDRVRPGDPRDRARDHGPRERELADVVGLQHARLGQGLRREQPDHADHAVHPGRRDGPGHRGRVRDPDTRRGARRHGVLPDRATRGAGHLRLVRLVDVDADGRADVRDPGAPARAVRAGRPGAPARRAVPQRRQLHGLQAARLPGGLRERDQLHGHDAGRSELQSPHRGLARGRPRDRLREVHARRGPGLDGGGLSRRRRPVRERSRAAGDARRRPGPALPGLAAHARQLRDRVLALGAVGQQQLRAVGAERRPRRRAACQRGLEAPPRRVRGARSSTRRSTRSSWPGWISARRASPTRTSRRDLPAGLPRRVPRRPRSPRAAS